MPLVRLVARNVLSLPPVGGQRTDYHDEGGGLVLRVSPSGARVYSVVYTSEGRVRRYTLGSAYRLDLADAREAARRIVAQAALGNDPQTRKVEERRRKANAVGVEELVSRFLDARAVDVRPTTMRGWRSVLKNHIGPALGTRSIEAVSRSDVKSLLASIAAEHRTASNRVLELLRLAYAWALDQDPPLIEASPCASLKKLREKPRERVLTSDEIRRVWDASKEEGTPGAVIRFLLLSGQRPGEVVGMRASELDLRARLWRIPSERMKSDRPHVLPLSGAMLRTIESVKPGETYVFESGRLPGQPIATLQHAHDHIRKATGIDFQIRDLRRTMRTGLSAIGVSREIAERILAHALPGLVGTYDKHVPLIPMRDALERWARHVEAILAGEDDVGGEVVAFSDQRA